MLLFGRGISLVYRRVHQPPMSISLTESERQVFGLLQSVNTHFKLSATMRVAGGWVRDKLLGRSCDDIDIALDNMMGKDFAEYVNKYLAHTGLPTHQIGVIASNPEQSKHLETATMKLCNHWIDFVHLRAEEYTANSRIPIVRIGTPVEDAMRRDFTINSMFFNLATEAVEDFVGTGLADLKQGVLRTPLAPRETFLDDPLRVLRAVRFSSRFHFDIVPEIVTAAKLPECHEALLHKISRERIGAELEGMLKSSTMSMVTRLLREFGIWSIVFPCYPTEDQQAQVNFDEYAEYTINLLQFVEQRMHPLFIQGLSKWPAVASQEEQKILYLALLTWYVHRAKMGFLDGKGKLLSSTSFVLKDALKFRGRDTEECARIHDAADVILAWKRDHVPFDRLSVAMMIRICGSSWRCAVVVACADCMLHGDSSEAWFLSLLDYAEHEHLSDVYNMKPLVSGKDISAALGIPQGPKIGVLSKRALELQLYFPLLTAAQIVDALRETGT
ncbi:mitochondrial tRNA nucleotidyltransferase/poly(A) polymerase family domain-containing protein [Andalucia godoyi]|uniref:Mitochondrial tRNA nucleotidyltransferase/poly(A) polymerase family domain-containing protein n=1 Tax=Andalucia godoyi TaxID=505711 RepID=A0A8K0F446_ANDGO|nr:mitochondrial tRNA nucleotidyltransferase/poly(A) polymerase family domain-containing protein [Andalucia godoyi]|eukprot:ANDGO_02889.mRNA.1 mitochondrial tRNA nucleotidyltransferase/poly(A) polymerase family domain-containing protein (CCA tRNA nucleotidyltransferase)